MRLDTRSWCEIVESELVIHIPIGPELKSVAPRLRQVRLTVREQEVLRMILKTKCNKEIAQALNIAVRSVKFHVTNILAKVGVSSRNELFRGAVNKRWASRALVALLVFLVVAAAASARTATLTWTASPTSGVTGYNVYRATTSCNLAASFTKIATGVTGTTYVDSTVPSSGIWVYCYYVTAVVASGAESSRSNEMDAPPPLPTAFFGMSVFSPSTSFPLSGGIVLGTLGKQGGLTIEDIEPSCDGGTDPSNSCYTWTTMDSWVSRAQSSGYTLVYDFDSMPYWMCGNATDVRCTVLPTSLGYLSNFATALATRYRGEIRYYETYNEANVTTEWTGSCADLVLLHNTIRNAVKAADSAALVGAPNLSYGSGTACGGSTGNEWGFLSGFLAQHDINGNLPVSDTAGEHFYERAVPSLPSVAGEFLTVYGNFRSAMTAAGIPTTAPLLTTEGSFGPASNSNCSSPLNATACLSAQDQVAYIGRWLVLGASTWAEGAGMLPSWYAYDLNYGTLNGSSGMNPQNSSAYGQMESWLAGGSFSSMCTTGTPSTVYVCDFSVAGANREIVFNDNAGASASYTPPGWALYQKPLLGTQSGISGTVSVNNTPILLTPTGSSSTGPNPPTGITATVEP